MIMPDLSKKYEHENNFYLSCDNARIGKLIAHYELYKMVLDIPGQIVEAGVFKGASFARFAAFRTLLETNFSKKIIGFDMFGEFPETDYELDKNYRENFINTAGSKSISEDQLLEILNYKKCNDNIELIAGNILTTVPNYIEENPNLKISLLHIDVDIYEPTVVLLENLYPLLSKGGVLILDDYGFFPGETKAVDEYFKGKDVEIRKFPFSHTPAYIIKNNF